MEPHPDFFSKLRQYCESIAPRARSENSLVVEVASRTRLGEATVRKLYRGNTVPKNKTLRSLLAPLGLAEAAFSDLVRLRSGAGGGGETGARPAANPVNPRNPVFPSDRERPESRRRER
jgi:hypothetical protein